MDAAAMRQELRTLQAEVDGLREELADAEGRLQAAAERAYAEGVTSYEGHRIRASQPARRIELDAWTDACEDDRWAWEAWDRARYTREYRPRPTVKSVRAWAADAMAWCVAEGIINGRTETTLEPGGNATRAEVATMLMRMCKDKE